jgi:hypothetical protein
MESFVGSLYLTNNVFFKNPSYYSKPMKLGKKIFLQNFTDNEPLKLIYNEITQLYVSMFNILPMK